MSGDPDDRDPASGTTTGTVDRTSTTRSTTGATASKKSTAVKKPSTAPRASDAGRSRLGDLTRPIAVDRRIAQRRPSTVLLGVVAVGIAVAIAAALFVLPTQTFFAQDERIERREAQLDQLESVNAELEAEVDRLRTDAGVREAAREEIGFAEETERRLTLLALPDLPTEFPPGWPYDLVTGVLVLRSTPAATEPPVIADTEPVDTEPADAEPVAPPADP